MDNNSVPRIVFEAEMARWERTFKRLLVVILVLILLLFGSNVAWIVYESQFEDVVYTSQKVEQDADGGDNHFVGVDYYGTSESKNNNG